MKPFRFAVRAKCGVPRIVATSMWRRDEAETFKRLDAWNRRIHRVRARIDKIFGTWKRSYGLRRMRWRGLAKVAVQVRITAIRLQPQTHDQHCRNGAVRRQRRVESQKADATA